MTVMQSLKYASSFSWVKTTWFFELLYLCLYCFSVFLKAAVCNFRWQASVSCSMRLVGKQASPPCSSLSRLSVSLADTLLSAEVSQSIRHKQANGAYRHHLSRIYEAYIGLSGWREQRASLTGQIELEWSDFYQSWIQRHDGKTQRSQLTLRPHHLIRAVYGYLEFFMYFFN